MLAKTILSGVDKRWSMPASALIPTCSQGLDKDSLHKRASIFEQEYRTLKPKPKHAYIHLISVASGEHYGPNSNGDFYNGDAFDFRVPHPEDGKTFIIHLDGGIKKYHNKTFMDQGAVYRNHMNRDNHAEPCGKIICAKTNPVMHRGELIVEVPEDTWGAELELLARDIPLKWSIGCDAKHDICSRCGHVATTEDGHCDHYKHALGNIDEDGVENFVISDNTVYHDISLVPIPAEKIAFSIRRVASAGDLYKTITHKPNVESLKFMLKTSAAKRRLNSLLKLAKIEKTIDAITSEHPLPKAFNMSLDSNLDSAESLRKFLDYTNHHELLGALKQQNIILPPDEFIIVFGSDNVRDHIKDFDIKREFHNVFNDLTDLDYLDTFLEDDYYEPQHCYDIDLLHAAKNMIDMNALDGDNLSIHIIDNVLNHSDDLTADNNHHILLKTVNNPDPVKTGLALEYADYLLSAVSDLPDDELINICATRILPVI